MRIADGLKFDVMMEGKAKDISILKLRPDLLRFAPDVAARFGIRPSEAARLAEQERMLDAGVSADGEPDVDEGAEGAAAAG